MDKDTLKNNVITILVDSVFSDCIGKTKTQESSTPYIDSLINDGIFTPNMFSYGPYTDAATKGLYSGRPSLNDYGYYYGLNSSNYNHFRVFSENGYETYGFYYPYYLIGPKIRKYIDHTVYVGGFDYSAIWIGKYEYYSEVLKIRKLSKIEKKILINYTDLLFDCWKTFYHKLSCDFESSSILNCTKDFCCEKEEILNCQYDLYVKNKDNYINDILKSGKKHPFFEIDSFNYGKLIDKKWIKRKVYKKYKKFFSELDNKEFLMNIKNNKYSIKEMAKNKVYLKNSLISLFSGKYSRIISKNENWQLNASLQRKIDTMFSMIDDRFNDKKPFYFSLHTEEPHNYISYFTYDIKNESLVDEEINYLYPLIKNCGKDFKGNLIYQLSLRYVDLCIKRLVKGLDERGLLNNTTLILVTDHGTSYSYDPIRNTCVNNFYTENYKTPFLIWNAPNNTNNGKEFGKFYSAEDVQKTICKELYLKEPKEYNGVVITKEFSGREYVITEYMGPGCPDMITKTIWMTIRNGKYIIGYKGKISGDFSIDNITEIYDKKNDYYEENNIVDKVSFKDDEIANLVQIMENRFLDIKKETSKFIKNIDSWSAI